MDPQPKRERRFGSWVHDPKPRAPGTARWDFSFGLLLFATTVMVVFGHETAYRLVPTEDREYPLLGLVSHFGSDMLIVGGVVSGMAVLLLHWRESRGR